MDKVLTRLNAVPGVVGSLICDDAGAVLSSALPPAFELPSVDEVAHALADGAVALELSPEGDDLVDFRFRDLRVLARPLAGGMLAVFCGGATNPQLVVTSMGAAAATLARTGLPRPAAPSSSGVSSSGASSSGVSSSGVSSSGLSSSAAAAARSARAGHAPHVPVPTRGLEELRRRLAEGPAAGPGAPPRKR